MSIPGAGMRYTGRSSAGFINHPASLDMRNALGGKPAGMGLVLIALFACTAVAVPFAYAATGSVAVAVVVSGGTAQASDFKLTMKKKNSNSGVTGAGNLVTFSAQPGTYGITVSGPSRYTYAWTGDCGSKGEIVIVDGAAKKCTLTATYGSKPSSGSSGGSSTPSSPRTVRSR